MPAPELLLDLLRAPGPTGLEARALAVWREAASSFADVSEDALGNVVARVPGRSGDAPLVGLFAHVDEIGIAVTHVTDEGYLELKGIGGWDAQVLLGQRVEILARGGPVPGVVGRRRDLEKDERVKLEQLHVDVGARDRDDALRLVRIGDRAVIAGEPVELANGRLASRALDNRLGAYVVLEAARRAAEAGGAGVALAAVANVGEEATDYVGARAAAYGLEPRAAVVVDVTFASDVPGARHGANGRVLLGGGPSIMRGAGLSERLAEALAETAESEGIPYCFEVSGGRSETDADGVAASRAGVPTAVLSVPIRYFHMPVELVDLDDLEHAVRLLAASLDRLA